MNLKEATKQLLKNPKIAEEYYKPDIAFEVETARWKRHLTQKELATKMKTYQSFIARIERHEYNPTVKSLMKIAKILKMDLIVKFRPMEEREEKQLDLA